MKNQEETVNIQNTEIDHNTENIKLSPFGHLFRLLASWLGFTGLYAMFAVCPFCGQQGCPVGIASSGTFGAFFALCFQDWKRLFLYIKQKLNKKGDKPVHRTAKKAALTDFFRRQRCSRPEADPTIPNAAHPEQRKTKSIAKSSILLLFCALALCACAHTAQYQAKPNTSDDSFYDGLISFYRGPLNHLRAVRSGECPMYPSCSEYSRQAIARFGFAKGWVMTMDRLMRCGRDETRIAPKVWINGKLKYYDPVENNILWHSKAAY